MTDRTDAELIKSHLEKIADLEAQLAETNAFLAASSLCEGCQQKRVERAIIATPRIQVEEERDSLRRELTTSRQREQAAVDRIKEIARTKISVNTMGIEYTIADLFTFVTDHYGPDLCRGLDTESEGEG